LGIAGNQERNPTADGTGDQQYENRRAKSDA
jgi:hypothetical protein